MAGLHIGENYSRFVQTFGEPEEVLEDKDSIRNRLHLAPNAVLPSNRLYIFTNKYYPYMAIYVFFNETDKAPSEAIYLYIQNQ